MNPTSFLVFQIRSALLIFLLFLSSSVLGQQKPEHPEIQRPEAVPYADILTSKMQRPSVIQRSAVEEDAEMQSLERSSALHHAKIRNLINMVCLMFLFGSFCAIWAQNTARNPLLWFALGAFFTFVAIGVILRKNAKMHRRKKKYRRNGTPYVDYAQFY